MYNNSTMNEEVSPSLPPGSYFAYYPPKCPICLETYIAKCSLDSCTHQFCISCLLKWSKIKAECPLCKRPFKFVIDEYKEYYLATAVPEEPDHEDRFFYSPPVVVPDVWYEPPQQGAIFTFILKALIVIFYFLFLIYINIENYCSEK